MKSEGRSRVVVVAEAYQQNCRGLPRLTRAINTVRNHLNKVICGDPQQEDGYGLGSAGKVVPLNVKRLAMSYLKEIKIWSSIVSDDRFATSACRRLSDMR